MVVRSIGKYKWKGKKALIVEDDPTSAFLLSEILVHTGIKVQLLETGKEAVEICKIDPDIDIILLDMQIPEMSGFEAAAEIRKINRDVPIIAQSAFVLREEEERAIAAGCNVYLSKPLNTFQLLGIMHQLLHGTEQLPE